MAEKKTRLNHFVSHIILIMVLVGTALILLDVYGNVASEITRVSPLVIITERAPEDGSIDLTPVPTITIAPIHDA